MLRLSRLACPCALFLLLSDPATVFGQCSKDMDCKGNRICVKGACVDPSPSSSTPSPPAESAPSEAEVKTCVAALEDLGGLYGDVKRVEYGTPMLSQGGMAEMRLGAPSGTRLYPVRLRFRDFRTGEAWLYRDPFGSLKCTRHGEMEYRPPTTKEEMAAAIRDGETVKLPVKILMNTFGPTEFSDGTLSISRTAVGVRVPNPSLDFSVPPDQIYDVDSQNWQLHLHLLVYNARDRKNNLRQDVYLWDPAVQAGRGRSVDCSRCGDIVSTLKALINVARGKEAAGFAPSPIISPRVALGGITELRDAIEAGQTVTIPVKYVSGAIDSPRHSRIFGGLYMADGALKLSKTSFAFEPSVGASRFIVAPDKILTVEEQTDPSRLHVSVAVTNKKGKEKPQTFYFFSAGAVAGGDIAGAVGGGGAFISCSACDDSMNRAYHLLVGVRAKP
jgi:hypothetical protein